MNIIENILRKILIFLEDSFFQRKSLCEVRSSFCFNLQNFMNRMRTEVCFL